PSLAVVLDPIPRDGRRSPLARTPAMRFADLLWCTNRDTRANNRRRHRHIRTTANAERRERKLEDWTRFSRHSKRSAMRVGNAINVVFYGKDARIKTEAESCQDLQCPQRPSRDGKTWRPITVDRRT